MNAEKKRICLSALIASLRFTWRIVWLRLCCTVPPRLKSPVFDGWSRKKLAIVRSIELMFILMASEYVRLAPGMGRPHPARRKSMRATFSGYTWLILSLTAFGVTWPATAQPAPALERVGTPWLGARGVQENTAAIMAREKKLSGQVRPEKIKPRPRPDFQNLPANPDSPNVASWPPAGSSGEAAPAFTLQTVGLSFTAGTLADTQSFPPDTMGAVGPAQFLLACNGRIRTFNKRTGVADGVLDADMDIFFQSVMTPPVANNFTTDPRVRYDRLSSRWFVTIIDVPGRAGSLPNRVLLAVSDGATITASTAWTFFYFQHDLVAPAGDTGQFADYPTLGIDASALYIGVNLFGTRGSGSFNNTTAFVVRKSSLLGAGPIVVTAFRSLVKKVQGVSTGPFTPQGVDNYDPAAAEGYFIGVDAGMYGRLALRRISSPGGTPAISDNVLITVPITGGTINVPHLGNTGGTAGYLDGLDYRLLGAHLRNGRLWTAANIALDNTGSPSGTDTRSGIRWYELSGLATGQTPAVVQSGTLFQSSSGNTTDQRHYWMGAIMVSGQGHAAMGFSVAGANEHINAGTAGRLAGDPLGTMRPPSLYTASAAAYNPPDDPGGAGGRRWGDYSYTSLDPDDDMTMWTIQEFCDAQNSYAMRVVQLLAPPPATPWSCSPASLPTGASNVSVVLTGVSTNGSGFFDPGPGFPHRLAAAVNGGGVAVQSVQYTDPTHLTLGLTVLAGAAVGTRTINVTNPDGQVLTSAAGILTIGGSNPPPRIQSISLSHGSVTISWSAVAGETYRVQYKADLNQSLWNDLPGDITALTNVATKVDDPGPVAQRFYRVRLWP